MWKGATELSLTMYMWKAIQCRACPELPNGWLPYSQAQRAEGHHSQPHDGGMPWYLRKTNSLSVERLALTSAITTDGARVDIQTTGFWGGSEGKGLC